LGMLLVFWGWPADANDAFGESYSDFRTSGVPSAGDVLVKLLPATLLIVSPPAEDVPKGECPPGPFCSKIRTRSAQERFPDSLGLRKRVLWLTDSAAAPSQTWRPPCSLRKSPRQASRAGAGGRGSRVLLRKCSERRRPRNRFRNPARLFKLKKKRPLTYPPGRRRTASRRSKSLVDGTVDGGIPLFLARSAPRAQARRSQG